MNIYDSFRNKKAAQEAVNKIRKLKTEYGTPIKAYTYMSQETANKHDPFPFILHPPIVHVSRDGDGEEKLANKIDEIISKAGGVFVGT